MPHIPLTNLHHLIFSLTSFDWLHSIMPISNYSIISYCNITFDLYVFVLCPLFQEYNWGAQQGYGVYIIYIIRKAMHLGLVFHCTCHNNQELVCNFLYITPTCYCWRRAVWCKV